MNLNKSNLPYLFEEASPWVTLSNQIEQRLIWQYAVLQAEIVVTLGEEKSPILLESIERKQHYRFGDYEIWASAVAEWQYLDHSNLSYSEAMLGYRGYWRGEIQKNGVNILQPEVAMLLGLTNDIKVTPAYIETVSQEHLHSLLDQLATLFEDDDAIAFHKALPIETPVDAPNSIFDALRRTRAQARLLVTRGRSAVMDLLLKETGVVADQGGWRILPEELTRREQLGLRGSD